MSSPMRESRRGDRGHPECAGIYPELHSAIASSPVTWPSAVMRWRGRPVSHRTPSSMRTTGIGAWPSLTTRSAGRQSASSAAEAPCARLGRGAPRHARGAVRSMGGQAQRPGLACNRRADACVGPRGSHATSGVWQGSPNRGFLCDAGLFGALRLTPAGPPPRGVHADTRRSAKAQKVFSKPPGVERAMGSRRSAKRILTKPLSSVMASSSGADRL